MGKLIDLTGKTFGQWTVLGRGETKKTGSGSVVYWRCRCECGQEKEVRGADLKNGKSTSCGCSRGEGKQDISGLRFGKLVAIENVGKDKYNNYLWRCRCDCGNETVVASTQLRQGKTKSCGCLQRERTSEVSRKDLTNMRFGSLVAIKPSEGHVYGEKVFWDCICDCGTHTKVNTENLMSGATQSCGCVSSRGEGLIAKILSYNKIPFEKEKIFSDCVNENTGYRYRFDFFVNKKYIIEFDGIQHFEAVGRTTPEILKDNQYRDKAKNQYCFDHDIPIIRIPYTHYNQLCLEDLLLETSSFIVRKKTEE